MNPSNPIHLLGTIDDLASLNDLRHQVQAWPTHTTVEPPQLHVVKTATIANELEALIQHKQRQQTWAHVNNYNYLEPKIMQMKGSGSGLFIGVSERIGHWTGGAELSLGQSKLHYTSNGTGELSGIGDHLTQWRLVMERHFDVSAAGWSPSVYAGWAKRSNKNNFQGATTTGAQAYRRSNERSYLPLGVRLTKPAGAAGSSDEWSVSAELRPVLSGQHTTRLTDVGATENNTSKQTGRAWGLQAQRNWGPWRLTVYTNQWDMNATDPWKSSINGTTYTFKEPANETRQTGLRVSRLF